MSYLQRQLFQKKNYSNISLSSSSLLSLSKSRNVLLLGIRHMMNQNQDQNQNQNQNQLECSASFKGFRNHDNHKPNIIVGDFFSNENIQKLGLGPRFHYQFVKSASSNRYYDDRSTNKFMEQSNIGYSISSLDHFQFLQRIQQQQQRNYTQQQYGQKNRIQNSSKQNFQRHVLLSPLTSNGRKKYINALATSTHGLKIRKFTTNTVHSTNTASILNIHLPRSATTKTSLYRLIQTDSSGNNGNGNRNGKDSDRENGGKNKAAITTRTETSHPYPKENSSNENLQIDDKSLSNNDNNGSISHMSSFVHTNNRSNNDSKTIENESSSNNNKNKSNKLMAVDQIKFLIGSAPSRLTKKNISEWDFSDLVSVSSIVLLLSGIVLAPWMARQMQKSDNPYEELSTDDPIVDMAKILKKDLHLIGGDKQAGGEGKTAVDMILSDLLNSKALQQAATKFVVQILSSEDVRKSGVLLLKELWKDLVEDPETTEQVIHLLNVAIQNDEIKLAAKKLVLNLVNDEQVLAELIRLVQKLGQEHEVASAVQTLLSESAHNALNDPEILDHSMDFATDVVGDDIVQQTAGKALRNTVSYAVQPGISIGLVALGVSLLLFSIASFGYARSSEQDAAAMNDAILGLTHSLQQSSIASNLQFLTSMPYQSLSWTINTAIAALLLPLRVIRRTQEGIYDTVVGTTKAMQDIFDSYRSKVQTFFHQGKQIFSRWISSSVLIILYPFQIVKHFIVDTSNIGNNAARFVLRCISRNAKRFYVNTKFLFVSYNPFQIVKRFWISGTNAIRFVDNSISLWSKELYASANNFCVSYVDFLLLSVSEIKSRMQNKIEEIEKYSAKIFILVVSGSCRLFNDSSWLFRQQMHRLTALLKNGPAKISSNLVLSLSSWRRFLDNDSSLLMFRQQMQCFMVLLKNSFANTGGILSQYVSYLSYYYLRFNNSNHDDDSGTSKH